jgi:hypothetical protein
MAAHPLTLAKAYPMSIRSALILPLALIAAPVAAQDAPPAPRPAVVQQLYDCRAIPVPADRLACFDRQVAALEVAENARDIRYADRAAVREARRGLFGLSLRNLNIFGGGDEDDEAARAADPDVVDEIDAVLTGAQRNGLGLLVLTLDNGQRWVQTTPGGSGRTPRAGQPVHIRRASLGSFMASVDGRPGVRVRREQ